MMEQERNAGTGKEASRSHGMFMTKDMFMHTYIYIYVYIKMYMRVCVYIYTSTYMNILYMFCLWPVCLWGCGKRDYSFPCHGLPQG